MERRLVGVLIDEECPRGLPPCCCTYRSSIHSRLRPKEGHGHEKMELLKSGSVASYALSNSNEVIQSYSKKVEKPNKWLPDPYIRNPNESFFTGRERAGRRRGSMHCPRRIRLSLLNQYSNKLRGRHQMLHL